MNDELKESFKQGISQRIGEELPGLTKAAHEMVVNDIISTIENDETLNAASNLAGMNKEAGLKDSIGFMGAFKEGAGKALATIGIGASGGLGIHNLLKAKQNSQRINQYADFQNTLAHVAQRNEFLANENSDRLNELGNSIFKFAPTVANDPLVLETVMSNAIHGGGLDPQTVRSLQELEERYHKIKEVDSVKNFIV